MCGPRSIQCRESPRLNSSAARIDGTRSFIDRAFFSGAGTHTFENDSNERNTTEREHVLAPDVAANLDSYDVLAWEMNPGDCLVFSGMVFHGGRGNHSPSNALRALATRWAGDDATYALRPEGADPQLEGHGLTDGDPFGGEMFPLVWPKLDRARGCD